MTAINDGVKALKKRKRCWAKFNEERTAASKGAKRQGLTLKVLRKTRHCSAYAMMRAWSKNLGLMQRLAGDPGFRSLVDASTRKGFMFKQIDAWVKKSREARVAHGGPLLRRLAGLSRCMAAARLPEVSPLWACWRVSFEALASSKDFQDKNKHEAMDIKVTRRTALTATLQARQEFLVQADAEAGMALDPRWVNVLAAPTAPAWAEEAWQSAVARTMSTLLPKLFADGDLECARAAFRPQPAMCFATCC